MGSRRETVLGASFSSAIGCNVLGVSTSETFRRTEDRKTVDEHAAEQSMHVGRGGPGARRPLDRRLAADEGR